MKLLTFTTNCSSQALSLVVCLSIAVASNAEDNETSFGGGLGIGSDYTFRGVSQTMGNHSVQASVDIGHPSGLYAYVWGSNIDFVPEGDVDDGARYETNLAIGYSANISDKWAVDLALVRYLYPGTVDNADYDFNEMIATLWFSEKYSATVAFSNNVDNTNANSLLYELGAGFDLLEKISLQLKYGYYDLSNAYGSAYSYTSTTLARNIGNAVVMLGYVDTHDSADLIFDERIIGPRYVLSFQIDW